MKTRFVIILSLILLLQNIVNAYVYDYPCSIFDFINKLPQLESVSKKFRQEKIIKTAKKPLYSEGNFMFEKNKGVTFETTYPIKSTVSYTNRDYKQINDIILAISNKKYSKLEKEFSFYYHKDGNEWVLGLKPKQSSQINDYLSSITIWGTDDINKIIINFKNGNKTNLWFSTK